MSGFAGASSGGGSDGPTMITLPQGYRIDSTEVTREQYASWLATAPAVGAQDALCFWNTSFAPDAGCLFEMAPCQGPTCGNRPQACVDWCDAYTYCKAVHKRLCGKIGGGSNGHEDYADATLSQWYNACVSGPAGYAYPYGNALDVQACNGNQMGLQSTLAAASMSGCQSSVADYAGVYDLSGNVWEWEDSCDGPGVANYCHSRGGSFEIGDPTCDLPGGIFERYRTSKGLGFRCCADL